MLVPSKRRIPWMPISALMTCLLLIQTIHVRRLHEEGDQAATYRFPETFRFETPYFGLTYAGESGNFIDDRILQYGAFEKPELYLLRKIVGQRKGLVFLDIGANVGTHSLFMSQLVERVHAVEPFPPVLAKLHHNLDLNHLTNVTVHPVGFGNEKRLLPFHAPPNRNLGIGSFSRDIAERWEGSVAKADTAQQLSLEIGDEYLQQQGVTRIDIAKVDIEGYEKFALQGLRQTLLRNRPCVLLELNIGKEEGFHSLQELESAFPPRYRFYQIVSYLSDLQSGTYKLKSLSRLPEESGNLLAIPEEHSVHF